MGLLHVHDTSQSVVRCFDCGDTICGKCMVVTPGSLLCKKCKPKNVAERIMAGGAQSLLKLQCAAVAGGVALMGGLSVLTPCVG